MKSIYILDIETLQGYFLVVAKAIKGEYKTFEVSSRKHEMIPLIEFLNSKPSIVTFNGLNYDYPILHYILTSLQGKSAFEITDELWNESTHIINTDFPAIPLRKRKLPVLDLMALHGFKHGSAKHASLKWLEMNMQMKDVREMPINIYEVVSEDKMDDIVTYCKHDVDATELLYHKSLAIIELRKELSKKYNLSLINAPDQKMGELLFQHAIAKAMGKSMYEIKNMQTARTLIRLDEVIKPVVFESEEFSNVLGNFISKVISADNIKGALDYSVTFDGMIYNFGLGGLHASRESGIYESTDNMELISADVKSYYPNLAINQHVAPAHLGKAFLETYSDMYEMRKKTKKGSKENYAIKITLNSIFGKMADKFSFLRDEKALLTITINGQLQLAKLAESLTFAKQRITYANTDGLVVEVTDKRIYEQICKDWERNNNGLELEHDTIDSFWLKDVNNYIWKESNNDIKLKGAFELNNTRALHKDFSANIVRKAVYEYFINNIPLDRTINTETNIYEFLINVRAKGNDWFSLGTIINGALSYKKIGRYLRYFITHNTKTASVLKKTFKESGNEQIFHRSYSVTEALHLTSENANDYNINRNYYIIEARKLITPILHNKYRSSWQKSLF